MHVIVAYQSMKSRTTIGTTYLQCKRYYKKKNISMYPNQIFIEDLVKFIIQVKVEGNKVIPVADVNELVVDR